MAIIQVLRIAQCPSWLEALSALETVLRDAGESTSPEVQVVESLDDAAGLDFGGSPTITWDGRDIFGNDGVTGLACRVYPTEQGLRGAPTPEMIRQALKSAGFFD